MGYACEPGFNDNTTLPPPEFYDLPRIALIRRGGPTNDDACTFRTKILNAQANNSIGALIYNNPGATALDGATAKLDATDPLEIPGMLISYDDGIMLRTFLQQTQDIGTVDFFNRVRVNMALSKKRAVIWEFVLIVVVILLAILIIVSVVLHCRLYALRQRIRMDALARGADVLPNGNIRMRKVTIDKAILDELPVRVYEQSPAAQASTTESTTRQENGSGTGGQNSKDGQQPQGQSTASSSQAVTGRPASLTRTSSSKGSFSSKSVRSLKAMTAATILNSSTNAVSAVPASSSPVLDEITSDTCAVCLDEFTEGEEIRTLPCHHEFHCECIDPWLTRKSSTCPLCKYDCLPQTTEEAQGRGEDANIVLPNDRLIEFVMGPDWVAARVLRGHNGNNFVDRVGHAFGSFYDRLRRRPVRPFPGPTVVDSSLYRASSPNQRVVLDEHGQVPLQLITPRGVSNAPVSSSSSGLSSRSQIVVVSVPAPVPNTVSAPVPVPVSASTSASASVSAPVSNTVSPKPEVESQVVVDIPTSSPQDHGHCPTSNVLK
ncbi:hypothetical protein BGZ50_001626 [Haplosporangium sp. Z 11]|nr:hypothetical protein BGZ50_001626 [Haplosporangium sp. Z 11]